MAEASVLQLITDTDRRGAQVAALELEGALRSQGITTTTAALRDGSSDGPRLPVDVVGWPFTVAGAGALRRAKRSSRVVLGHGSTTLWAGSLATAGSRVGFVYRSIGQPTAWTRNRLHLIRTMAAIRHADHVVALWPRAADVLVANGVPRKRITVIPQAAPAERYPVVEPDERRLARLDHGLSDSRTVVLYLGALAPEKRVDLAIAAVAALPDAMLLVAGNGPLRAELERQSQALGGRVRFLGSVPDPTSLYAAADVVVLPSRTEGVPGVLIEAGLRGLPVVATDVGGVSTVVDHGSTGLLVPSDDLGALVSALRDARDDPEMGARGRTRCLRSFTLDAVIDRWRGVLEGAMCA